MAKSELDRLQRAYKKAVDSWVKAIRAEEALASKDHSMIAFERWDKASFKSQDAQAKVKTAHEKYKDALRRLNYGI
jgi:hypothetical protein